MDSIELIFTYSRQEYIRAIRRYLRKRLRFGLFLSIGLLTTGGGLYFLLTDGVSFYSLILLILSAILLLILFLGVFYIPVLTYNRQTQYKDEYRLKFSPAHIEFKTSVIDSKIEWIFYSEIWESDKFYYLLNTKRNITIIPKRVLKTETEISAFVRLITTKINSRIVRI
jgi:hypothetical protein